MDDVENLDKKQGEIVEEKTRSLTTQTTTPLSYISTIKNAIMQSLTGDIKQLIRGINNPNFHEWNANNQIFTPPVKPGDYIWEQAPDINGDFSIYWYKNNTTQIITQIDYTRSDDGEVYYQGINAPVVLVYDINNLHEITGLNEKQVIFDDLFKPKFDAIEKLINDIGTMENQHKTDLLNIYQALSGLTRPRETTLIIKKDNA